MNDNKFDCPHCGSYNTASMQILYKTGHATGTATHTGVVGYNRTYKTTTYADGHSEKSLESESPIYGDITRDTEEITDLAKEVAPPQKPEINWEEFKEDSTSLGCLISLFYFPSLFYVFFYPPLDSIIEKFIACGLVTLIFIIITKRINFIRKQLHDRKIKDKKDTYNNALLNWEKNMDTWEHQWMCLKCGHKFYVD